MAGIEERQGERERGRGGRKVMGHVIVPYEFAICYERKPPLLVVL